MEKIFVFADFDWLKESQLIGELCYERLRGSSCTHRQLSHPSLFLSMQTYLTMRKEQIMMPIQNLMLHAKKTYIETKAWLQVCRGNNEMIYISDSHCSILILHILQILL